MNAYNVIPTQIKNQMKGTMNEVKNKAYKDVDKYNKRGDEVILGDWSDEWREEASKCWGDKEHAHLLTVAA